MSNPILSFLNNPLNWWLLLGPSVWDVGWFLFLVWCFIGVLLMFGLPFALPVSLLVALIKMNQQRIVDPTLCASRMIGKCGFLGNSDVYGLGVRLGVYLQWIASLIANAYLPMERRGLVAATVAYSIAMFIALLVLVFQGGDLYLVEVIVLLYLLIGGTTSVVGTFLDFTDEDAISLKTGIDIANYILSPSLMFLSHWFWVNMAKGKLDSFCTSPCGTSLFLMTRVSEHHLRRVGQFYAFLSIWLQISGAFYRLSLIFSKLRMKTVSTLLSPLSLNIFALVTVIVEGILSIVIGLINGCCGRGENIIKTVEDERETEWNKMRPTPFFVYLYAGSTFTSMF
jgi:hypothetical protein